MKADKQGWTMVTGTGDIITSGDYNFGDALKEPECKPRFEVEIVSCRAVNFGEQKIRVKAEVENRGDKSGIGYVDLLNGEQEYVDWQEVDLASDERAELVLSYRPESMKFGNTAMTVKIYNYQTGEYEDEDSKVM